MPPVRILWADDEIPFMEGILNSLRAEGFSVEPSLTVAETLKKLREGHPGYDLLILDIMLPLGPDIEDVLGRARDPTLAPEDFGKVVLEEVAEKWPSLPVIVFTAIRSDVRGMKTPTNYVVVKKPVIPGELFRVILRLSKREGGSNS